MAILKIARMGHPVLLQPAEPVPDPRAPALRRLVSDMMETMEDAAGVGLAAPQVHVSLRLFVFRVPESRVTGGSEGPIGNSVVINPIVTVLDDVPQTDWEGCLSIPGLRAAVPRAGRIRYAGFDVDGNAFERDAEGFHARVVQHETDHLDGILYTMRMTDFRAFGFVEELARADAAAATRLRIEDEGQGDARADPGTRVNPS